LATGVNRSRASEATSKALDVLTVPTSVHVDCQGTAKVSEDLIATLIREHFDLTPKGIIATLDLRKPIYKATATHGHFGRKPDEAGPGTFTWEKTDKAAKLASAAGVKAGATAGSR
jgi:S-adenosylmethionine synthetase